MRYASKVIVVLTGENSFEINRTLERLAAEFGGRAEKVDGSALEVKQLPDLLMGATLFSEKRFVIIRELSENKNIWSIFDAWIPRVSDDVCLVLVEPKPDKRTKTYKALQKVATVQEFKPWGERDAMKAEKWVADEAKKLGFSLDAKSARSLVARVGTEQWLLYHALEKLAVAEVVSPETIEEIIEANPTENVFNLFEAALKGDMRKVKKMLDTLEISQDPYQLMGLLGGQVFQLAVLVAGDKPATEIARDFGMKSPYPLTKLAPYAQKLGRPGVKKIVAAFAEADSGIKTSAGEPWLLIERALVKTAVL